MTKRIIFDLDNTLIMFKKEYWECVNRALKRLDCEYDSDIIEKMKKVCITYDNYHSIYTKKDMLNFINQIVEIPLPKEFVDYWLEELCDCSEQVSDDIIETFDYLKNKYDLVVLTNWFSSIQTKRLEKAGIRHYFTNIYGGDCGPAKPNKESYLLASKGYSLSECIMIGDDIIKDVEVPINIGMKAIYCNLKKKENQNNYPMITEIKQLMDIL